MPDALIAIGLAALVTGAMVGAGPRAAALSERDRHGVRHRHRHAGREMTASTPVGRSAGRTEPLAFWSPAAALGVD
jgi:hypothetical protein